jgi:Zn-dependent M28 family amino/carboxypeptidase
MSTTVPTHRHGGCRTGRPAGARPVAIDDAVAAARRAGPTEPDPAVLELLATLSRDAFLADVATLAAHPTRRSESAGFDEAATWVAGRLEQAGYAVSTQPVPRGGGRCRNVIGDRSGSFSTEQPPPGGVGSSDTRGGTAPQDVVLVTAHLDSINLGGPTEPAPGADDNASGSAGVLALARALADHPTALDLRMILFGGEEEGLFGSLRYVAALPAAERARIRAVVNMDMIGGRNTPEAGVLLEGAAVSQDVLDGLARAAATYTDLAVQVSLNPFNSDHVPFIDAGLPAVLTIEGADGTNHRPHTADDTLDTVDGDLALAILRMNLAYLVEVLG